MAKSAKTFVFPSQEYVTVVPLVSTCGARALAVEDRQWDADDEAQDEQIDERSHSSRADTDVARRFAESNDALHQYRRIPRSIVSRSSAGATARHGARSEE